MDKKEKEVMIEKISAVAGTLLATKIYSEAASRILADPSRNCITDFDALASRSIDAGKAFAKTVIERKESIAAVVEFCNYLDNTSSGDEE